MPTTIASSNTTTVDVQTSVQITTTIKTSNSTKVPLSSHVDTPGIN